MRDPYQVLGVSPGAPDDEIKRAFRRLAKELHPDLHPNDASADLKFRDVVRAYQTLSDPRLRKAYEDAVANHSQRRRSLRAKAVTMAAAFGLTVCSVSAAILWQDLVEALLPARSDPRAAPSTKVGATSPDRAVPPLSQDVASPVESDRPLPSKSAEPSSAGEFSTQPLPEHEPTAPPAPAGPATNDQALRPPDNVGQVPTTKSPSPALADDNVKQQVPADLSKTRTWASYRSAAFGFALQYPADVFVSDRSPFDEGKSFVSRDGRARLFISATLNTNGAALSKHRQSLMEGPYKGAAFDYTPQRSNWFVLSGTLGDDIFYDRVTLSCDGRTLHGWKLQYPVAERTFYDRIVEEMHRRYRHGNGPGGRCGEASGNASSPSRPGEKAAAPQ